MLKSGLLLRCQVIKYRCLQVHVSASVLAQAPTGLNPPVTSTAILEMLLSRGADPNSNISGDEVSLDIHTSQLCNLQCF